MHQQKLQPEMTPNPAEPAAAASVIRKKAVSMLSLSRKAGKLTAGTDMVKEAVQTGQTSAVFTASDLSPKSIKEIKYFCGPKSVPVISLGVTMDEMAPQIGRRSGILAVTDRGFETKIRSLLSEAEEADGP